LKELTFRILLSLYKGGLKQQSCRMQAILGVLVFLIGWHYQFRAIEREDPPLLHVVWYTVLSIVWQGAGAATVISWLAH